MRDRNRTGRWLCLLLFLILPLAAAGRDFADAPERVRTLRLDSELMRREMPYRVILPAGYDESAKDRVFPTLYLLHGLTGRYDDWSEKSRLVEHSAAYPYVIVMPEGGDGWYTDAARREDDRYESYIVSELIPAVEKKFRTGGDRSRRAVAGLSMGGYGALKFAVKYPDRFVLAGSFSGALEAARFRSADAGGWKALADSVETVFGADDSATRRGNDLFALTRAKSPEEIGKLPFLYLDCGTEDMLIGANRRYAELLLEKKVPHEYRQLPGRHDWAYWDAQIREFLELGSGFFK